MKSKILPLITLTASLLFANDYNGAELFTRETFQYGRFEARMHMAAASGLVSSMFLYYNDSYKGLPEPWREVDIEVLGKSPESFQSNIITGHLKSKVTSEKHHSVSPMAHQIYHTYAIEWTPDSVAWYLDGVQVRKSTDQQVIDLNDKEQNLRFNLWIADIPEWVGDFDPSSLPRHQFINWVKVYNYNPIPDAQGNHFTLAWQDDFDSFDDTRWSTANWTFPDNLVDFTPNNVNVQDGTLILSLTTTEAPGFSGIIPPDDGTLNVRPIRTPPSSLQNKPVRWFDLMGRTPNR